MEQILLQDLPMLWLGQRRLTPFTAKGTVALCTSAWPPAPRSSQDPGHQYLHTAHSSRLRHTDKHARTNACKMLMLLLCRQYLHQPGSWIDEILSFMDIMVLSIWFYCQDM